jgi:DedD protein
MKWAFWKRKPTTRKGKSFESAAPGPEPEFDSADPDAEEAAARNLRVRTRRRLIGACALLLAAVVLVPMVLDPTPHAVPDTIPIDLPSDKTPFTPHLPAAAPAAATESPAAAAAVPAAPGAAADTATEAAAPAAPAAEAGKEAAAAKEAAKPGAPAHEKKHTAADAPKSEAHRAAAGKIFIQAAALSRESSARELAGRIAKSGLTPFVERSDTGEGVRFRVRLGPYASRTEAEHARARLKAMGVDANIVGA